MGSVFCDRRIAYVLVPLVLLVGIGLVVYFVVINGNESEDSPEVTIPQGTLRGANMLTRNNRNIYGFMGIPFAEPPVGNLRFEAPVTAGSWNGTLDASGDTNQCPQLSGTSFVGEEDCLQLHVYTPRLPTDENTELLPVMFFIHGGAFREANNDPEEYGPYYLLDKDVILVAPRYRLGMFGFLSTGDEVVPGNNGLKDVVKALEWNRDNIKYFGGDPDRVTIFGQSAGAMIVHLMALSDSTDGLFHRFITQSGSALTYDPQRPLAVLVNRTNQLAEYFGCPTSTSTALVNCLKGVDIAELMNTDSIYEVWNGYPTVIWSPTIEPNVEGAFITDSPANLFAAGKVRNLPSIALTTQIEGILSASSFFANPASFENFLENIDDALPSMFTYDNLVEDEPAYTAALKSYYFNDLTVDRTVLLNNYSVIQDDAVVSYPLYNAVQKQLDHTNNTQYVCKFEYVGTFGYAYKASNGTLEVLSSTHMDDTFYLFRQSFTGLAPEGSEMSEDDWKIVDTMVQLWTSFAADGKPTTGDSATNDIWQPYTAQKNYLRIGNYSDTSLGIGYGWFDDRVEFWEELTAATTWV